MNDDSRRFAVSLFSGAGGMDLGVSQAGFDVLCDIELDPHCCETLRANIAREGRDTWVVERDIKEVDPLKLMGDLGLQPGELDLLFGGPPCQAFSQIGKQMALEDERGMLLFQVIRFAEAFQPQAILIEQVKGLMSAKDAHGKRGGVFQLLINDLTRLHYVPKWKILLAADYGVAQLRQRVFVVATKEPNGYEFPSPTHEPSKHQGSLFALIPYTTVGEAIAGLGEPSPKNGYTRQDSHVDVTPAGDRSRIHGVPEGSYLARQLHLPETQRKGLTHKDTTKFLRLAADKPSNTLRCGEIFYHPLHDRYLSPREYMRIHGYPDEYVLKGPIRGRSGRVRQLDQHRQVANSVPPPVAKALAAQILLVLECRESLKYTVTE